MAGVSSHAIAAIRSVLSVERSRISRPTGTIMAPPMPCTMRASTSTSTESASAQAADPSVNTTMATRNTVLAPSRSAIWPLAGMNKARLNKYAVSVMLI